VNGYVINKQVIPLQSATARNVIAHHLLQALVGQVGYKIRPVVVLAIGSDRYTGDSLGPLIGTYLQEHCPAIVYGSLEHTVHAGNLLETVKILHRRHLHPIIIAVDASLGKAAEVGNIEIWEGGLQAGTAVGHHLPPVGDISVTGVVSSGGPACYQELQHTPLSLVVKMSKIIGSAIMDAVSAIAITDGSGLSYGETIDPIAYIK
jgi:putative sporulation protein YyaC